MAKVELPVLFPCVYFVDANELPVSGIPVHKKAESRSHMCKVIQAKGKFTIHHMRHIQKVSYLLKKLPGPEFLSKITYTLLALERKYPICSPEGPAPSTQ